MPPGKLWKTQMQIKTTKIEELFFPAIVDSDDKVVSVDTTHAKCSNVGCHLSQEFIDTIKVLAINY